MLDALHRRVLYYAVFSVVFATAYAAVLIWLGGFPTSLLFGVLGLSLAKDVVDEYRIARGVGPVAFVAIEHLPSNLVLLGFLLAGVVDPGGAVAVPGLASPLPLRDLAVGLAVVDGVLDLTQDLREA